MPEPANPDPWRNALVLFGRELRNLRDDANLTQQALAERIGTSDSTLSDLELGKGERVPTETLVVAYVDGCLEAWKIAKAMRDERRAFLLQAYRMLDDLRERLRSAQNAGAATTLAGDQGADRVEAVPMTNVDLYGLFAPPAVLPHAPLPSMLLRPEYGVVPFFGRQPEVADLVKWATDQAVLAARLVTGPAGQGKTRLALRMCELTRERGWIAGIVSERADPTLLEQVARIQSPLFLVVDYAEARPDALLSLARTLTQRSNPAPARLLLLARSAGEWLNELHADPDDRVSGLFLKAIEQRLPPLARRVADRQAEFVRSLGAIAFQLRRSAEHIDPPPGIDTPSFERALDIHAGALAALLDESTPDDQSNPDRDPVLRVLHHEQRYWRRTAGSSGLPDPHQTRLKCIVAAATLFGADTENEAIDLVRSLPSFQDENTTLIRRFVRCASELYPGPGSLNPLRPDRLGEDHIAATLAVEPEIATAPPSAVDDARLRQALTVLGRGAPRHTVAATALAQIATGTGRRFVDLAMTIATTLEDPRPLVEVIERTVAANGQSEMVDLVLDRLPPTTLALAEVAVLANERALATHLRLPNRDPAVTAHLLIRLTSRLRQGGHYADALNSVSQAAEIYRDLAEQNHETYLPNLASTLHMQSVCLGDLGRHADAIEPGAQAVDRFRQLAADNPEAYNTELANALNALGNRYKAIGMRQEALGVTEEATSLYLELWNGGAAYVLPDLARSLNNLAVHLNAIGDTDRALDVVRDAVELRRQLADQNPDTYLPDLASSLNNEANILDDLDRAGDATASMAETVDIYRWLAEHRPVVYLPDLAMALNNYSINLSAISETAGAVTASAESAKIYQSLDTERPGPFRADLGMALNTLSLRLARANKPEQALAAARESVRVRRGLLPTDDSEVLRGLVASLNNLGVRLRAMDSHEEAADTAREAVERCRMLVERDPAYRSSLADVLNGECLAQLRIDQPALAASAGAESVAIFRSLHAAQPSSFRRRLLSALINYADALRHSDPDGTRDVLHEIADHWDPSADKDLADIIHAITDALDAGETRPGPG